MGIVHMTNKLPNKYPTFLVKAAWRATAIKFRVVARDEDEAWVKAAKAVKKMFGGMSCLEINVVGEINE